MQATIRQPRAMRAHSALEYDMAAMAEEYKALKQQQSTIDAKIEAVKVAIIDNMHGQESVTAGIFTIDYKDVVSNRLDTAALKELHPDIVKLFTVPSTSKRFTIR